MALDSKHPLYSEFVEDWVMMRDTYRGARVIRAAGERYLPATSGMHADGMNPDQLGAKAYKAYKARAVFHDFVKEAVETLIGVMHHKPATIELPPQMETMIERATIQGESLQVLLRRINEAQLTTSRLGLLLDIPESPPPGEKPIPYIASYKAEDIFNWDAGRRDDPTLQTLNFVCLNESEQERNASFEWQLVNKYRVLMLGADPVAENNNAGAQYLAGVFRNDSGEQFSLQKMKAPSIMGRTLQEIPFVFVNAKDIVPEPDNPVLLGLAELSLAIYRGEADYRQSLFMQGQDTLVTIGVPKEDDEQVRVGANAQINVPQGGDAKYIGVSSTGLPEQRQALEADKKQAAAKGGQLLDTTSRQKESGDALKTRVSAQTATLNQIALAGAFALQTLLRIGAVWVGADPEKVIVKPNLDFDDAPLLAADLVSFVSAKNMGAPLARETIHNLMRSKGLTELEYEDELALIEEEEPLSPSVTLPTDPNDPDSPANKKPGQKTDSEDEE